MELDNIKQRTTWNDASASINSNFMKVRQAILALQSEGGGLDEAELEEFLTSHGYTKEEWVLAQNALLEERIENLEQGGGGGSANIEGSAFISVSQDGVISLDVDPQGGLGRTEQGLGIIDIPASALGNVPNKEYVDSAAKAAYDNAYTDAVAASTAYTNSAKQQLIASKAGAFYLDPSTNMFTVFTTVQARDEYLAGGTAQENILYQQVIQGGGGGTSETTYRMTVHMDKASYSFTTASETMPIACTFSSEVQYKGKDSYEAFPESALFSVVVYKPNGTVVTAANGVPVSEGGTFNFDLKPYLGNGDNTVIVKATGLISSETGQDFAQVSVTTMSLSSFGFAWYKPWIQGSDYLISLRVLGDLSKTLHVKINNKEVTDTNVKTHSDENTPYVFTLGAAHHPSNTGVYKIEMWLTADTGNFSSEVLTFNIMCVSAAHTTTAQLVCINEVSTFADNYAENKIFSYAAYNGGQPTATPVLSVYKGSTELVRQESTVETGRAHDFICSFSLAMSEASASLVAMARYGSGTPPQANITLRNETSFAPVGGYSFYMDAATRSNSDAYRTYIQNEVSKEKISVSWTDMAWVEGMDGWTVDEDGNKCLLIPAMSKANVNLTPMKNITTATFEMLYKVKNASDFDEDIITIASNTASSWMGVKIKPTNICLHSQALFSDDLRQSYNTEDEEMVHMIVTILQNYMETGKNVIMLYVNGVKKCTFEWSAGDTFAHSGNLVLGSDTADLYFYKMRIYTNMQFAWTNVLQNYISCLHTTAEKSQTKRREDSVTTGGKIDYDKVYGKFNTFIVELPEGAAIPNRDNNSSNTPIEGTNLYINIVQDPSCSIQGEYINVPLEGQGTTAMSYFRWNLRSKTDDNENYNIRITAKKNVASSMHSHKMGATRLFNDLNRAIVGANDADGRVAVYQYPVYGFQKRKNEAQAGTYIYDFIGLYTIGPDKGDKPTFGYNNATYKSTLIHMEGTDHDKAGVGMDYPWEEMTVNQNASGDDILGPKNASGGLGDDAWEIGACGNKKTNSDMKSYLDVEFAPAYKLDYECTPLIVGLPSGTDINSINANATSFRAQIADNGFSYGDCLIYIDGTYDVYYFNIVNNKYESDHNRKIFYGLTSAHGYSKSTLDAKSSVLAKTQYIRECRKARYRAEMEQYWHLDDSLFHACFLDLIGATDNEKKNSYPYKFGTLASGSRWRWRQDDLDTIFDVNNLGAADKKYSILDTDRKGNIMIFQGNSSYHWRCIREYYKPEMKTMMKKIFDRMVALCPYGYGSSKIEKLVGCIRKYFWDYAQEYFTSGAYNLDAVWTYEDPWRIGATSAVPPLQQSLGSHYEAEVAWVQKRMLFLASMYEWGAFSEYQDASEGQISFRQGGDFTFELTPAIDLRPSIARGQSPAVSATEGRVLAGNTTRIFSASGTSNGTTVYIQGADWLSDIGDLSKVQIGLEMDFTVESKRLQKLKTGDTNAGAVTTNIPALKIKECPSLEEIDARNMPKLTGSIDLTKCPRLRRAYFNGTGLTGVLLPEGSKITSYGLPSGLQSLKLIKLPLLTASGLSHSGLGKLTYLWVEDNKKLQGYSLLKSALEGGSPLNNIRVVGFNITGDASDVEFLKTLANGDYHSIDDQGNQDNTSNPYLSGSVYIVGTLDGDDYDFLTEAFEGRLQLDADKIVAFIKFADPDVLAKLLANGIGSDGGVTREQAAAVTSLPSFYNDQTIDSFDELQYFTSVTQIGPSIFSNGGFCKAINLKSVVLPSSVEILGNNAFRECSSLPSINLEHIKTLMQGVFLGCTSLAIVVNMPNLTTLNQAAFYQSAIKEIVSLGNVTELKSGSYQYGTFYKCTNLTKANLTGITKFGQNEFEGCSSLHTITIDWTKVTSIGSNAFNNCTSLEIDNLNLSNLESLGQNAFYGVKIKKMNLGMVETLPDANYGNAQNYGDKDILEEVLLPSTLTQIPNNSFYNYGNLATCPLPTSLTSVGLEAFFKTKITGEINLPNLTTLGGGAFTYTSITKILSLGSITTITNSSNWLSSPNTRTGAFAECRSLQEVVLPETLTTLGNGSFANCVSLHTINIPQSIVQMGGHTFWMTQLSGTVNLPNLLSLGASEFRGTKITRVESLGSITQTTGSSDWFGSYRGGIFANCTELTFARMPSTCTTWESSEFINCSKLATLIVEATTPPSIMSGTFNGTPIASNNGYIYVPDESVQAYKEATIWQDYAARILPISVLDNIRIEPDGGNFSDSEVSIKAFYKGLQVSANWSVDGDVATISSEGVLTFTDYGSVQVTATYDGKSTTRTFSYMNGYVLSKTFAPASTSDTSEIVNTGYKLFSNDMPAWTLKVDVVMGTSNIASQGTAIACQDESGSPWAGFNIRRNGTTNNISFEVAPNHSNILNTSTFPTVIIRRNGDILETSTDGGQTYVTRMASIASVLSSAPRLATIPLIVGGYYSGSGTVGRPFAGNINLELYFEVKDFND